MVSNAIGRLYTRADFPCNIFKSQKNSLACGSQCELSLISNISLNDKILLLYFDKKLPLFHSHHNWNKKTETNSHCPDKLQY